MQSYLIQKFRKVQWLLALVAGGLLPLAFAPFQWTWLALVSPAFLVWLLQENNSKSSTLKLGFCYGLGVFGIGVSWVYVSIHDFGHAPPLLAALFTGLFVVVLALFFMMLGWVFGLFQRRLPLTHPLIYLVFPSLWVLSEWARSTIATGFPWLLLGNSHTDTPLAGFAPIGSVYLVSWVTAVLGGLLVLACRVVFPRRNVKHDVPRLDHGILALVLLVAVFGLVYGTGYALKNHPWTKPDTSLPAYEVALIQGNLKPDEKFNYATDDQSGETSEELYYRLTLRFKESNIILWPENAMVVPRPHANKMLDILAKTARERHQTWLIGIPTETDNHRYFNSIVTIGLDSEDYHKTRLVPFGEFVPFETLLRGLVDFFNLPMSDFIPSLELPHIMSLQQWKIAPFICYEIAYPDQVRSLSDKANVLITITEDGWFGGSLGPHQHLQIARMRSIENAKPLIRATTSGISAFIDAKGQVLMASPQFRETAISKKVIPYTGKTPWNSIGLWPLLAFCVFTMLIPFLIKRKKYDYV